MQKTFRYRKGVWLLLLAGLAADVAAGCGSSAESIPTPVRTVEVQTVVQRQQQVRSELSATLQAEEEATVAFEAGGRILQMVFKEGDRVTAGTALAWLDSGGGHAGAGLEILQAEANLETARSVYDKAKADLERAEALYQAGALSKSDLENVRNQWVAADNNYRTASQTLLYSQAKTVLKAPFSGTVLNRLREPGTMVSPGTPVYRIGNMDRLKVIVPVPDREFQLWPKGTQVSLQLYDETRKGTITAVHPTTDQGTGTVGVEVIVDNSDHGWLPGQVVKIRRVLWEKTGFWAPVQAVVQKGDSPYLFVLREGRAVKVPVTIGELINGQLEITAGLTGGETLIVTSADRLMDGDRVQPTGGR